MAGWQLFGFGKREFVAESVYRFYLYVGTGIGEFAAQIFHLGVDEMEVVGLVGVVAPDGLGQYRLVVFQQFVDFVFAVDETELFQVVERGKPLGFEIGNVVGVVE